MEGIGPRQKSLAFALARNAIAESLGLPYEPIPEDIPFLHRCSGLFVTLKIRGKLRGCIGTLRPVQDLAKTIPRMARSSAFEDPRFPPLNAAEFSDIETELSILSPMRKVKSIAEIQPGVHGLHIARGFSSGILLPQVALEQGWDREDFLRHLCLKAGLDPEAWKDPESELHLFTALVLREEG